jgi:hypothetical protein
MAHILTKVEGNTDSEVKITRALLSVSDKAGLVELAEVGHLNPSYSTSFAVPCLLPFHLFCCSMSFVFLFSRTSSYY